MLDQRIEDGDAIPNSGWAAGQVHDERIRPRARHRPRQRAVTSVLPTECSDRLRNTGRLPLEHCSGCLGCDIAGTETGPARGDDQIGGCGIRPLREDTGDPIALVGHDVAPGDRESSAFGPRGNGVARRVLTRPGRAEIGHSEHRDAYLHGYRLMLPSR